jgi:phosphoribosylformylglycinamidine cyclo-ligase
LIEWSIIGLESSGIHSNGYSLVRKLIQQSGIKLSEPFNQEQTFLDAFLKPTRLYVKPVLAVKSA